MNRISISILGNKTDFHPNELIEGTISWEVPSSNEFLTLQLFWYTEGKGTRDYDVVEETKIWTNAECGSEPFSFVVPSMPLSFSGSLISLLWVLELKTANESEAVQYHFQNSMNGTKISLSKIR